jgi:hypothetical protein
VEVEEFGQECVERVFPWGVEVGGIHGRSVMCRIGGGTRENFALFVVNLGLDLGRGTGSAGVSPAWRKGGFGSGLGYGGAGRHRSQWGVTWECGSEGSVKIEKIWLAGWGVVGLCCDFYRAFGMSVQF